MTDLFGRPVIDSFRGEYEFLSNFYRHPVFWQGLVWATSEHAYQAAKCSEDEDFYLFQDNKMTPGQAKRLGQTVLTWYNWDSKRFDVMLDIVKAKFDDPDLAAMLMATGDAILIEGNTWGDRYWGQCDGVGENNLGKILMYVRDNLIRRA